MFSRSILTGILLPAMLAAFSVHDTRAQPAPQPNVVLITIDTLRADYVGAYGNRDIATPNLDALASDGTLFARAYCQVPMTPPSHASILTGTYPMTHGVRDFTSTGLRKGFPTIASLLRKNGYTTAAFVSAYVLDSVWGLNQGFDTYYDRFSPKEFLGVNPGNVQRKAGETVDRVLDWLRGSREEPYFLWVHLYDPHHDYNPPEPFRSRYAGDLYGGEVAYTDQEIGRLIAELKKNGDYANSLVIAVSDHGESLGEHEEYVHGLFLYESTLRIPLILKLPQSSGKPVARSEGIVNTVDIAPTILQLTRTPGDSQIPMEGKGLLSRILGKSSPGRPFSYAETLYPRNTFGWSDLASYIEGKYKYIEAPRPEFYDLEADPAEKLNLFESRKALANSLRQKLLQFRQSIAPKAGRPAGDADPEKIEALQSLGYIAVTVPLQHPRGSNSLVDPKDRARVFNQVLLAMQAADAGKFDRSNAILDEVLREDPELFIAHYSMGVNYLKASDYTRALERFDRANALNPAFELTDMNRATALSHVGRLDEAIAVLEAILKKSPTRVEAKKQLALFYTRKKDYAAAIRVYEDVLASRKDDAQATKFLGIAQVESQKYADGAATLQKALKLGVQDALLYNFLGIAQGNLGEVKAAIESYRKALEIKGDYHQARLNLSFALLKAGRQAEAAKEFGFLCTASPDLCRQYRKYFP